MKYLKDYHKKSTWLLPETLEDWCWFSAGSWRDRGFSLTRPNYVFEAKLIPSGSSRGRSSALLWFTDFDNSKIEYPMTLAAAADFFEVWASAHRNFKGLIIGDTPVIHGIFTFAKRGTQYTILPYTDEVLEIQ